MEIFLRECIETITCYQEETGLTTEENEGRYSLKSTSIDTSYSLYNWLICKKTNEVARIALKGLRAIVEALVEKERSDLFRGSVHYFLDKYPLSQIEILLKIEKNCI